MYIAAFLEFLRKHPESLTDRNKFISFMRDFFPEQRMQVNLLVNAFDIGVVEELKRDGKIDKYLQNQLVQRLTNEYGVSQENADWAISLWCVCYGEEILNKACEIEGNNGTPPPVFSLGQRTTLKYKRVEFCFRWISPGTFFMGSPENEKRKAFINSVRYARENASIASSTVTDEIQHEVRLTHGVWMLESPVTQEMWEAVTGNNPSFFRGNRLPVENVSWFDSQGYIDKLNRLKLRPKGLKFGLPTEAEWEYACRAGSQTPFWFGDSLNGNRANCNGEAPYGTDVRGVWLNTTTEVGRYEPNAFGLFDMIGNVWEFCEDWYGTYPDRVVFDPHGTDSGMNRVVRGGSWNAIAACCRSAKRGWLAPDQRCNYCGVRLVLRPTRTC